MGCPVSDTDPDSVTILTKRGPVNKTLKSNSVSTVYVALSLQFFTYLVVDDEIKKTGKPILGDFTCFTQTILISTHDVLKLT
ncbi:unnamed protein product [Strongylus vulgaris]|uniref:Uncharacterized protein n=1 Tax=Strongylus vulgaris TaxID=40348 RepID=A0A3P7K365_STRVU|nr:unnamed protein product [Strongylus vulgaris]